MALIGKQLALVASLEANAVGTTEIVSNSITASEVAANAVGHGAIDAIGIGPKGEPGVRTLNKWPFPGIGLPSLFRRKKQISTRIKKNASSNK